MSRKFSNTVHYVTTLKDYTSSILLETDRTFVN